MFARELLNKSVQFENIKGEVLIEESYMLV